MGVLIRLSFVWIVANVNGSGGGLHLTSFTLPAGAFSGVGLDHVLTPAQFPLVEAQLTASNQAGSFSDGGGNLAGAMPLAGSFRFCIQQTCGAPPVANLVVPLGVVGHATTATAVGFFNQTVVGGPWTTGTVAVVPGFATLTLHFVPEPATLALLGAGILGLAWRGARHGASDR